MWIMLLTRRALVYLIKLFGVCVDVGVQANGIVSNMQYFAKDFVIRDALTCCSFKPIIERFAYDHLSLITSFFLN